MVTAAISLGFSLCLHLPPRQHLHHGECPVAEVGVELGIGPFFLSFYAEVLELVRTAEKSDDREERHE